MAKKRRGSRAAHRANETRAGRDTLTAELVKRTRKLVALQGQKRSYLSKAAKLDAKIADARQQLKAAADAAVNQTTDNKGELS